MGCEVTLNGLNTQERGSVAVLHQIYWRVIELQFFFIKVQNKGMEQQQKNMPMFHSLIYVKFAKESRQYRFWSCRLENTDLQDENCYPVSLKVNAQHLNF